MPFYLENVLGYNPRQVGLLLAVVPLSAGAVSPLSGIVSDRIGTRPITVLGLFILLGGYIGLRTLNEHTTSLGYIIRFLPIGLGTGIFQSPNNSAIMGVAPREKLGIISSILSITRTLGQTSGIAAVGAFWSARVAHYVADPLQRGATSAPAIAQVESLKDTFLATAILISIAFILSLWALLREIRRRYHSLSVPDLEYANEKEYRR